MRSTFLPFSPPLIGEEEITEVVDTLRSDWITTGPKVRRFEEEFAAFIGAPAALALNSCTTALHTALAALGIGPGHFDRTQGRPFDRAQGGDAVIGTPLTFCSTIHVIEHVGARPLLVDVEPETLNIDPKRVEEAIEQSNRGQRPEDRGYRVRAILPVHLYGHPCEMDALLKLAREHDLALVEDAAHALPAAYKGRMIGSAGIRGQRAEVRDQQEPLRTRQAAPDSADGSDLGAQILDSSSQYHIPQLTCFSFYATKNLTTAEGGMLTGPPELIEEARIWSLHGMSRDAWKRYSSEGSWYYEVIRPGFKYNMTDIQAATGIHQLRRLPEMQRRRKEIWECYDAAFGELEEIQTPVVRPEVEHAWHLYVIRLNLERLTIDRARFIEELRLRNIGASVHFIPVHLHPYYRDKYGFKPEDFPVAYREYQRIVSLPLYPRMTDQDVQDVIDAVVDIARSFRR